MFFQSFHKVDFMLAKKYDQKMIIQYTLFACQPHLIWVATVILLTSSKCQFSNN
jgi:heme/copper-type cytochrome/quinol oxidase subunit 3